MIRPAVLSSHG